MGGSKTDDELKAYRAAALSAYDISEVDRINGILANRQAFRDAIVEATLAAAIDSTFMQMNGQAEMTINAAVAAYGKENDDNGVTINFGNPGKNLDADTNSKVFGNSQTGFILKINVTFRVESNVSRLAITVVHEGQHIVDAINIFNVIRTDTSTNLANSRASGFNLDVFDREMNGYTAGGYAAKSLGITYAPGGRVVWQQGWKEPDRQVIATVIRASFTSDELKKRYLGR